MMEDPRDRALGALEDLFCSMGVTYNPIYDRRAAVAFIDAIADLRDEPAA